MQPTTLSNVTSEDRSSFGGLAPRLEDDLYRLGIAIHGVASPKAVLGLYDSREEAVEVQARRLRSVLTSLPIGRPRILDFGFGNGLTREAVSVVLPDRPQDYYAVERIHEFRRYAQERYKLSGLFSSLEEAHVDEPFDLALCMGALTGPKVPGEVYSIVRSLLSMSERVALGFSTTPAVGAPLRVDEVLHALDGRQPVVSADSDYCVVYVDGRS